MEARLPIYALVASMRQSTTSLFKRSFSLSARRTSYSRQHYSAFSRQCAPRRGLQDSRAGLSGNRKISSIATCPTPTCACAEMPQGLDIDYKRPLDGSMSLYHEHVLIPTGRSDWKSRVEEDDTLPFLKDVKSLLTKGGKFANPFHNVLVSASSHPEDPQTGQHAALLLPSFQYITPKASSLSSSSDVADALVKGFILPRSVDQRARQNLPGLSEDSLRSLERDTALNETLFNVSPVHDVVVLICGHGSRDNRCGIMGAILGEEFQAKLSAPTSRFKLKQSTALTTDGQLGATIGLISHIGGHAFAGNVIVYVPSILHEQGHALAGKGIWYGRVEPRHVEGIVRETIEQGRVIKDLFRGGVDANLPGTMLRV